MIRPALSNFPQGPGRECPWPFYLGSYKSAQPALGSRVRSRHMKIVTYRRVSTAKQGKSGLGLEAQEAAIQAFASERSAKIIAQYTEIESGKTNERPQLAAALHHAKVTGAVLIIAKLDRLSRSASFTLTLRDSGVHFVCCDMPEANDLTIGVLA